MIKLLYLNIKVVLENQWDKLSKIWTNKNQRDFSKRIPILINLCRKLMLINFSKSIKLLNKFQIFMNIIFMMIIIHHLKKNLSLTLIIPKEIDLILNKIKMLKLFKTTINKFIIIFKKKLRINLFKKINHKILLLKNWISLINNKK